MLSSQACQAVTALNSRSQSGAIALKQKGRAAARPCFLSACFRPFRIPLRHKGGFRQDALVAMSRGQLGATTVTSPGLNRLSGLTRLPPRGGT